MASTERIYGQGSSAKRKSGRQLQDVVYEFHHWQESLFRRDLYRTETARTDPLHKQVRRPEPARRNADDDCLEAGILRNRIEYLAGRDPSRYPCRGLLSG